VTVQSLDALGELVLGLEVVLVDFLEQLVQLGKVRARYIPVEILCKHRDHNRLCKRLVQRTAYLSITVSLGSPQRDGHRRLLV
jgi:hypothetical protein